MEKITPDTPVSKRELARNARALHLIALFMVVMIPFLVHFNLLHAPMQGDEFRLLLLDDALHYPDTALAAVDTLPGSPLGAFAIGLFWWLSGGAMLVMRAVSLLIFVLSVILLVQALRLWLARTDSMTAPTIGGALFAVSPFAVAALVSLDAWPALFGCACASASAAFFLNATHDAAKTDYLSLILACIALALGVAAHHSMVLIPVVLIVMDLSRLTADGKLRMKPAWTAWGVMLAAAVAASATLHTSGASFTPFTPPAFMLFGATFVALPVSWLAAVIPGKMMNRIFTLFMIAVLHAGGVVSFKQALQYVEPVTYLEQQLAGSEDPALGEMLVLHYIEAAEHESGEETRFAMLMEALTLWREYGGEQVNGTRRILGERLFEAGNVEEAAQLLEPFLSEAPFDAVGYTAAIALARTTDEKEHSGKVADYYAYARKTGGLSSEDVANYGKTLMLLGDMAGAAMQYAVLPELDEKSESGILKKQASTAYAAAQALLDKAREQMTEDPTDPAGYVSSAEREMLLGNAIRAFYWLELALRRDPGQARAWELMGVLFARHDQAEQFVAQWGATKSHGDQAWLRMTQQAAMFQAWEGALIYGKQFVTSETPAAEAFLGAFALEMRNLRQARNWFERATTVRPDDFTAWLALADIAAIMQQPDEASKYLEEAGKRNAPAEEIEKRKARLEGSPEAESQAQPFEPVRTYIQ